MDRRSALTSMLGRKRPALEDSSLLPQGGFSPYSGSWTTEKAAHLLRRTMFGPNLDQIKWSAEQGMEATLSKLFEELPMPEPPINFYYEEDANVPVGSTWVDKPYSYQSIPEKFDQIHYRKKSLNSWQMELLFQEGISIREKLTLFWHNHFPIIEMDPSYHYLYITTLRKYAWGNFRQLTKAITIDPAMLAYLDGNENTNRSPNENYARELLELFTVGKGPQIGPGDYTNYTEHDIKEIAKVLTGWTDSGMNRVSNDEGEAHALFQEKFHDQSTKKLSAHFGEEEIPDMGDQEYAYLIDIIFKQAEVARFISRKLYRWFVYYEIDEQVEAEIIEPMAQVLFEADFDIKPALMALLRSEHFYHAQYTGAMIKNPMDFLMSFIKPLKLDMTGEPKEKYYAYLELRRYTSRMQMEYFSIPQVAGWRAYYIEPFFYREWINSTTLKFRNQLVEDISTSGVVPAEQDGMTVKLSGLEAISGLEDSTDPDALIRQLAMVLFPRPIQEERHQALKQVLLNGLPDFEWTVEYGNYRQNPDNRELGRSINGKLLTLLRAILNSAEFQLS